MGGLTRIRDRRCPRAGCRLYNCTGDGETKCNLTTQRTRTRVEHRAAFARRCRAPVAGHVSPLMKTIIWLLAPLIDGAAVVLYASSLSIDQPPSLLLWSISLMILFLSLGCLVVASRFVGLRARYHESAKLLCASLPVIMFIGSLDLGIISGLEIVSIIFSALLGWLNWRAFLQYARTNG